MSKSPSVSAPHARFAHPDPLPPGYAILDSLSYPVLLLDTEARFVWLNHVAEDFFQRSHSRLIGRQLEDLLPADSGIFPLLRRVFASGRSIHDQNIELASPKIGRHLVDVQMALIETDKSLCCVSLQPRSLAEKLRGMSSFKGAALSMTKMSALLAHEIKNPLAGIKGAAQLLEMEIPEDSRELSQLIVEEADRITRLLSRIEHMASDAPVSAAPANIHEILDHTIRITKASFGRHIDIETRYDPSLPVINVDREMLIQAFINILKNASEAIVKNGKITIETSYSIDSYFTPAGARKSVHLPLQITIADNGIGIADELQDLLFEPFISDKANGTGLGLAMVASVVSDHGGMVSARSVPGETILTINLPLPPQTDSEDSRNEGLVSDEHSAFGATEVPFGAGGRE